MSNKYEELVFWYLRLNGYLTVEHFILHPLGSGPQRTEVDVLGVRFPNSKEVAGAEMKRDDNLVRCDGRIDFIIAEVKSGMCDINGPWKNPDTKNWEYVLKWLGKLSDTEVSEVAKELQAKKEYVGDDWAIRIICFGNQRSQELSSNILQLEFEKLIDFLLNRFDQFRKQKRDIEQWPQFIKDFISKSSKKKVLDWLKS